MNEAIRNWNERYGSSDYLFGREPSRFLVRQQARLKPGMRALAVADGEGRNGVWMASLGLDVLSVDGSAAALAKARRLAAGEGQDLAFAQVDLLDWDWPVGRFDIVAAIFIQFANPQQRTVLFAKMRETLRPGGLLLLHGYRPEQVALGTGGPPHEENMYTPGMLRESFADFDILELAGYDAVIHEGRGHDGPSALIDLVARKPGEGHDG
ncbi:MAG: class I SAM-dependent methyltransferase [Geminicoccaceae bacterium]|nr:class I SAM-dependent methyltransferase [Geminicoccaceae bacterium]